MRVCPHWFRRWFSMSIHPWLVDCRLSAGCCTRLPISAITVCTFDLQFVVLLPRALALSLRCEELGMARRELCGDAVRSLGTLLMSAIIFGV